MPSSPRAFTRSSTRRVLTPCTYASRTVATSARSARLRGSSRPGKKHEALQTARRHQQTEAFKGQYAARAGVEGTHEQAVRRSGLRRSRYIGLDKTRLQHVATAAALDLIRISEWCAGTPLAKTRCSRFAALRSLN
jgi:transposase